MGKYSMSDGTMIEKSRIDFRVTKAKKLKLELFRDEHGYIFCERTNRSDLPLDCSHIISVRLAQETGRSEIAWCQQKFELLNRDAHNEIEKWPNDKREAYYLARKGGITYEQFIFEVKYDEDNKSNEVPF